MDCPKLRNIDAFPVESSGRPMICLRDPERFTDEVVAVPYEVFFIVSLFDGRHTLLDIQAEYMRKYGNLLFKERIVDIVEKMDSHLLLDSDRFKEFKDNLEDGFKRSMIRRAAHAGKSYDSNPQALKKQIEAFFLSPEGPGLPLAKETGAKVSGVIAPHIDLKEGGPCFAWAYKEIAEKSDADLFIIFGTAHQEMNNLFAFTRKDFETPLGTIETDREFLEIFEKNYEYDLFADEFTHRSEHTVEFQLVFLQHLFAGNREIKILPVLCGSFHEMIRKKTFPSEVEQMQAFTRAFKIAVSERKRRVCIIASADLAHIGPRYGDRFVPTRGTMEKVKEDDLGMLGFVEKIDKDGFFSSIERIGDGRRICGLPPIYTMLSVSDASEAKLLKYSTAKVDNQNSFVSFASMALY